MIYMYYGFMAYGEKHPVVMPYTLNAFGVVNGQNKAKFGSHFEFQNGHQKHRQTKI